MILKIMKNWRKILSNFHLCPFQYKEYTYNSIEHAFQSQKIALVLFEKAYSGWWWGKTDESKSLFLQILNDYKITNEYEKRIKENLDKMGVGY
jgi:hypothetical protein